MRNGPDRTSDPGLCAMRLLALAAAIVAAAFAAGFAVALLVAAIAAIDGLGVSGSGLCKGGDGEDGGERKNCDGAFHKILLEREWNG